MTWASWLLAAIGPVVGRVLAALGAGFITYAGLDTAMNTVISHIQASMNGLVPEVLQILAIAGLFKAMSIVAGGIVSGMVFMQVRKFSFAVGK